MTLLCPVILGNDLEADREFHKYRVKYKIGDILHDNMIGDNQIPSNVGGLIIDMPKSDISSYLKEIIDLGTILKDHELIDFLELAMKEVRILKTLGKRLSQDLNFDSVDKVEPQSRRKRDSKAEDKMSISG